ncbi:DUF4176 domain-containing protein [Terribacillus saccharophilus]|jgi:hypothetical protein|uniref:DUF4176 domain-containing protein n=1 Tax=Terribacillus saccharophilus TaxID=361277 RepID=A0ABX4GZL7_9BACI|nr:DUF4176 domain-containing protein [Terribacillus saccharophilus]PAD36249.1 hypothetical protein CHH56_05480 [Terribacillus saccharophilus]PAD96729.1 hypothetical protein CHH50_06830 [Terribacillus saccharophilus]PAE00305.1 hypothetical protein CHH48_07735 [Terribacillus saccharophilus]
MKIKKLISFFFLTLFLTGCSVGFTTSSGDDGSTEQPPTVENVNTENLIPIGSVVKLKGAEKPVMIHGYEQQEYGSEKLYDYISVPYPEGHIRPDYSIFFNRVDIEEVLHVGYVTPEDEKLREEADSRLKEE